MNTIEEIIARLAPEDSRAALYYLSRYLKLTPNQDDYEKDIFEDDDRSLPTDEIKAVTKNLITFIEKEEGVSAADFNSDQYVYWSECVMNIESRLESTASAENAAEASKFIEELASSLISVKDGKS